jgi:hypothetical protein
LTVESARVLFVFDERLHLSEQLGCWREAVFLRVLTSLLQDAWPGPHRWNRALGVSPKPVAPGLRVLPRSAAFCHLTQGKLSGVLRSSGFVRKYSQEFKKDVRGLSRGALLALDGYDWPGNVRELENIIERSVALATRPVIRLDDLPLDLAMNEVASSRGESDTATLTLKEARSIRAGPRAAGARARGLEPEPRGQSARCASQYVDCPPRRVGLQAGPVRDLDRARASE